MAASGSAARPLPDPRSPQGRIYPLRFAAPYGPVTHRSDPLPEGADSIEGIGVIADLIEALAVLQDHTTVQIAVPDFAKLTLLQARAILHAADLIRGAVVTVSWEGISLHVHPGTATPGLEEAWPMPNPPDATGLDRELTRKTCRRMADDGQLTADGHGRYWLPGLGLGADGEGDTP